MSHFGSVARNLIYADVRTQNDAKGIGRPLHLKHELDYARLLMQSLLTVGLQALKAAAWVKQR